jgi:tripartite-type tricarboxylate transporter receptor subunit TctC
MRYRTAILAGSVCALALATTPALANDAFKGKTVTYIVATAAGGGYDGFGRLTARYMEKHLPGSTFVVVNKPGAGHVIGTNLIYAARPDGLTIGTFNTGVVYSQLLKTKAVRYDLSRMSWIGKATADKRTIMVAAQSPYKTFADLQTAKTPVPMAMSGVGSAAFFELKLLAKVFDLNFRFLFGYSGNDDEMAMLRGEVAGKMGTFTGQGPFVRSGKGRFLLQIANEPETAYGPVTFGPDIAKTEQQKAVINLIASQAEMYRVTAGPPNIRAPRLAALREAYGKAYSDPALLADAKKLNWRIIPLVGEKVAEGIRRGLDQPPEIIAMLHEVQKSKPADIKTGGKLTQVNRGGREIVFTDAGGKTDKSKISGSRTTVKINGKGAKRSKLKIGMACAITYKGPGTEASLVACK